MRLIALVLALVSMDAAIAATTGGAATSGATSVPTPALGTSAWAEAVEKARDDFDHAATSTDLAERYRQLLALYHGCTRCRTQVYRWLESKLKSLPADETTALLTQDIESDQDPVSLGHLLVQSGRASRAKQVATAELRKTQFAEQRLRLLEVLGEADGKLGDLYHQRQIAKRLLKETPISWNYCDKALVWMSWLGEEAIPTANFIDLKGFPQTFDRLRELEARRGNDAYVSCRFYHELDSWDRTVTGLKNVHVRVDEKILSLFPNGISVPLQDLARRTSDPKIRAALLLSAAFRMFATPESSRALPLVREAKAASPMASILAGALQMEIAALGIHEHTSESEALALDQINGFPGWEVSCEGCIQYWAALTYPWPEPPNRMPEWRDKCLALIRRCPDPIKWWSEIDYPNGLRRSRETYEAILDMAPPAEVVPTILLRLSEELRDKDPTQAWETERKAILDPQYPCLNNETDKQVQRQHRAEAAGDFEIALYLDFLAPHYRTFGFEGGIPGDRSDELGPQFRRSYLRLRLGGDPEAAWSQLLALLPATPQDGSSRRLLQPEYLDRLLAAAIATHEELSALDWFRAVRQRFQVEPVKPASWGDYGWSDLSVIQAKSMLDGYVLRLESVVHSP